MNELRGMDPATRIEQLERANRRWRRAAVALAILAGAVAAPRLRLDLARPARAEARADDPSAVALANVEARMKLSREALDIIQASWNVGAPVTNQPNDVYDWSTRMLGTQIYVSMSDNEPRVEDPEVYLALPPHVRPSDKRLKAFEAHRDRMAQWASRLRPLAERRIMSRLDFMRIEAHLQQAELWVARERMKAEAERKAQR